MASTITSSDCIVKADLGCGCISCIKLERDGNSFEHCKYQRRIQVHDKEVSTLLCSTTETITLLAGPDETPFVCHKSLLGFYSEIFYGACFGLSEKRKSTIELSADTPAVVAIFVSWLYTGRITPGPIELEVLWVFGDKILSPRFVNEVMYSILSRYGSQNLTAQTADYVYTHTTKESKLRKCVRDLIICRGPLTSKFDKEGEWRERREEELYMEKWRVLIAKGGELVDEVFAEGSFWNDRWREMDERLLCRFIEYSAYMEDDVTRDIEEFATGVRSGTGDACWSGYERGEDDMGW